MKLTHLLFAFTALFISDNLSAQKLDLGVKLGTDINKLQGKSFSQQFSYGYHLGGFVDIGLTKKWGIQPEILFSSVKADTSSNIKDVYQVNNVKDIKLNYLKIPIMINYKPNSIVDLQIGPEFGVLMDNSKSLLVNGQNAFKNNNFSMVGGLQLNISKLKLYGRYAIGLTNINDIDNKDKWRNQTVQIGLGYTIF